MSPSRQMGRFPRGFAQHTIGLLSIHNAVKARGLVEQYRLEGNVIHSFLWTPQKRWAPRDSSRLCGQHSDIRTPNVTLASAFSHAPTTCPWLWCLVEPQTDLTEHRNGPMERIILQSCCSAMPCYLSYGPRLNGHSAVACNPQHCSHVRCKPPSAQSGTSNPSTMQPLLCSTNRARVEQHPGSKNPSCDPGITRSTSCAREEHSGAESTPRGCAGGPQP